LGLSAREAPLLTILTAIIADDNKKKFARQERFGKKRRRFADVSIAKISAIRVGARRADDAL
jgi:hypothetical protein